MKFPKNNFKKINNKTLKICKKLQIVKNYNLLYDLKAYKFFDYCNERIENFKSYEKNLIFILFNYIDFKGRKLRNDINIQVSL